MFFLTHIWFPVYKDIWNPRIVEDCLKSRHEKGNEHDDFVIDVYQNKRNDFPSFHSQNIVVRLQQESR